MGHPCTTEALCALKPNPRLKRITMTARTRSEVVDRETLPWAVAAARYHRARLNVIGASTKINHEPASALEIALQQVGLDQGRRIVSRHTAAQRRRPLRDRRSRKGSTEASAQDRHCNHCGAGHQEGRDQSASPS
jgi:hypothetical protein